MLIWFDKNGQQAGVASEDILSFPFETVTRSLDDYDPSKKYRLENDEIISFDPPEFEEDQEAIRLAEIEKARRSEYPRIEDQLDYIYHNGIEAWKTDIIDPIKTKYPKPE